mmetsp:Transcript_13919/g.50693  ORF Transcript_13919/g.50693 Transcript_13919/m.50693 type:complete len:224 (-) Transcript_13919:39-710(-)
MHWQVSTGIRIDGGWRAGVPASAEPQPTSKFNLSASMTCIPGAFKRLLSFDNSLGDPTDVLGLVEFQAVLEAGLPKQSSKLDHEVGLPPLSGMVAYGPLGSDKVQLSAFSHLLQPLTLSHLRILRMRLVGEVLHTNPGEAYCKHIVEQRRYIAFLQDVPATRYPFQQHVVVLLHRAEKASHASGVQFPPQGWSCPLPSRAVPFKGGTRLAGWSAARQCEACTA